ncbi:MAG: PH domain-containing protein [Phycisphaerae bacterium]|jgi:DNA-directed RNA polymerase subunit RPC12/RpoP
MATLTCDRCRKPFAADGAMPGDKVACPSCGDVTVVKASAASDPAVAAGFPARDGPETELLRLSPVLFRSHPGRFAMLSLGIIGGVVAVVLGLMKHSVPLAAIGGGVAVACAIAFVVWKIFSLHDGLLITTRRVVDREGLLSKNTSEVMIKDIRQVVIQQSFFERLFNVGTISFSSSAGDGVEVSMEHVAKPEHVKRVVDLYR